MKIALVCNFVLYAALTRCKSSTSDKSVQTVILKGNRSFLWQNHALNEFLRRIQYYKHGLPMKTISVRHFSVFAHLGSLGPLK